MKLSEFLEQLETAQIDFEIQQFDGATYVEFRDGDLHFGYRFNAAGNSDGGWLRPSHGDLKSNWKRWGEFLQ